MSETKFACPVCGQHITCDSRCGGTKLECPTCFRELVVPQASTAGSGNLVISASEVSARPAPLTGIGETLARPARKPFPFAAVGLVMVLSAAAGGAYLYREEILKTLRGAPSAGTSPAPQNAPRAEAPPANDNNWTLSLAGVKTPDTPAAGRINGRDFLCQRATLTGGTLSLRYGAKWPPELGLTVLLIARQGEDLAGKTIFIEPERAHPPKLILRSKNEQGQPVTQDIHEGYALRLEFGQVTGGQINGRIYLCSPDNAKSYVAGTFIAELRKPSPPKPAKPANATQPKG